MPSELKLLLRARYPLIWLQTTEEDRAVELICAAAFGLGDSASGWSQVLGIHDVPGPPTKGSNTDPLSALAHIREQKRQIWILKDLGALCHGGQGALVCRALRETTRAAKASGSVLVCVGSGFDVPPSLEGDATVHALALPDRQAHGRQLARVAGQLGRQVAPEAVERLGSACLGLTLEQAENVWARVHATGGQFTAGDVAQVIKEKARMVRGGGVLEFVTPMAMDGVGGLEKLKAWIATRAVGFSDRARQVGLPWPRGLLLVGVQGCGKSLIAKAVAGEWGQPLLRMDVGALMGSLVGQSEANLRHALAIAERVAPSVLWVDEIEKAFSGGDGSLDGGTSRRMLGTLLTWLQEREAPVFVLATSNDISSLPPEMLRKGRFDEIFFVDLPNEGQRREIWRVHLSERSRASGDSDLVNRMDLAALARGSDGYSGAEIAAAVVEAAFEALAEEVTLEEPLLHRAVSSSPPLSRQRSEDIDALRAWARGRARPCQ